MLAATLLLISAVIVGSIAPLVLQRIDVTRHEPSVLLVAWLSAMAGVFVAVACSVVSFLLPEHGVDLIPEDMMLHQHWHSISHGAPPIVECVAGLMEAVLLAAGLTWLATRIVRVTRHQVRMADSHAALLRIVGELDPDAPDVLRLGEDEPIAFSLRGTTGLIVVTAGVFQLGDSATAAVLAHERAHLRWRHHTLTLWIRVLGDSLSFAPLFRHAPPAVAELIELCADGEAARECGDDAVRSALLEVRMRGAPAGGLAMADRAVDRRLLRLARRRDGRSSRTKRVGMRLVAGSLAVSIPIHLTVTLLQIAAIG